MAAAVANRRRRPASVPARRGSSVAVSDAQRARISSATVAVLRERGYGQLSVARITARAGVSRRTFYEVFADREDCFAAVFEDALARAEAVVLPAYASERAWSERVRAGLAALLRFLDERRDLAGLLFVDALRAGPRVLRRRAEVMASLGAALDAGGARGGAAGRGQAGALTGEGVVGAVFSVIHTRLLSGGERTSSSSSSSLRSELLDPLMAMVVLPYRGAAAARRELDVTRTSRSGRRGAPGAGRASTSAPAHADPLARLPMRLTYRTLRVLGAIAAQPGASNRAAAEAAEVTDAGQISKLLARLERLGLIANKTGPGHAHGEPNAWALTSLGERVQGTVTDGSNQSACAALGACTPDSLEGR